MLPTCYRKHNARSHSLSSVPSRAGFPFHAPVSHVRGVIDNLLPHSNRLHYREPVASCVSKPPFPHSIICAIESQIPFRLFVRSRAGCRVHGLMSRSFRVSENHSHSSPCYRKPGSVLMRAPASDSLLVTENRLPYSNHLCYPEPDSESMRPCRIHFWLSKTYFPISP
jgi:hypothetical protein